MHRWEDEANERFLRMTSVMIVSTPRDSVCSMFRNDVVRCSRLPLPTFHSVLWYRVQLFAAISCIDDCVTYFAQRISNRVVRRSGTSTCTYPYRLQSSFANTIASHIYAGFDRSRTKCVCVSAESHQRLVQLLNGRPVSQAGKVT